MPSGETDGSSGGDASGGAGTTVTGGDASGGVTVTGGGQVSDSEWETEDIWETGTGGGSTGTGGGGTDPGGTDPGTTVPGAMTEGATDTDTGEPPGPLTCSASRYAFTDVTEGFPQAAAVDGRGHVVMLVIRDQAWEVRDVDPSGVLVNTAPVGDASVTLEWGGVDADDAWYLAFRELEGPGRGVRKFDVSGALEWQADIVAAPDSSVQGFAVGPDGTSVVSEWLFDGGDITRLSRFDSDGMLVSTEDRSELLTVEAVNAAGSMAFARIGEGGRKVGVLAADGSTVWSHGRDFDERWLGLAGDGALSFAASSGSAALALARHAPSGAVLWESEFPLGGPDMFSDVAINEAGQFVIGGLKEGDTAAPSVLRVSATGESDVAFSCNGFSGPQVAIDEAGAMYMVGVNFLSEDAPPMPFVAAFD